MQSRAQTQSRENQESRETKQNAKQRNKWYIFQGESNSKGVVQNPRWERTSQNIMELK